MSAASPRRIEGKSDGCGQHQQCAQELRQHGGAARRFGRHRATASSSILVGPSGCGKSTLLRMIAGLEEITAGEIAIGDRVVNDLPPKDRDIAMVFQSYALYPHMTVAQNMGFSLKLRARPQGRDRRAQVGRAAEILGLEPLSRALSRGSSRAASASASPWAAPSCATRRCSCSTSRCRTSTPSCASQMRSEIKRTASAAEDDDRLRHARPDRGDDHGRPDRRDARRRRSSRSARRSSSTTGRPICSSPASSARRR